MTIKTVMAKTSEERISGEGEQGSPLPSFVPATIGL